VPKQKSLPMDELTIKTILNQIFDIEKKVANQALEKSISRNLSRLKAPFKALGYTYHNPLGEKYALTRLDCEATIAGASTDNLVIIEVIKPIIYFQKSGQNQIIQKGIVITTASSS